MLFKSPATLGTGDFGSFFLFFFFHAISNCFVRWLNKGFQSAQQVVGFLPPLHSGKIAPLSHQQCYQRWFRLFTEHTIELSGRPIFPLQQAFLISSLFSPLPTVGFSLGLSLHLGFMAIYCPTSLLLLLLAQCQNTESIQALLDPKFLHILNIMNG